MQHHFAAFVAPARFTDPSERGRGRHRGGIVDPDDPALKAIGECHRVFIRSGPHVGGESTGKLIGDLHGFIHRTIGADRTHRTERLGLETVHFRSAVGEERGRIEPIGKPVESQSMPSKHGSGSSIQGVLDLRLDRCNGSIVDQRPQIDPGLITTPADQTLHPTLKQCHEPILQGLGNQDPIRTDAGLTSVSKLGSDQSCNGVFEVRSPHHDEWRVAAKFKKQPGEVLPGGVEEDATRRRRAGEGNQPDSGVGHEFTTDRLRITRDDVEDPTWNPDLFTEFRQRQRGQRSVLGRLHDQRASLSECGADLLGKHCQWEVPGRDDPDDPDRSRTDDDALAGFGRIQVSLEREAIRFPSRSIKITARVVDLTVRFGQGLSLLRREKSCELVTSRTHQLRKLSKQASPVGGALRSKSRPGRPRGRDRAGSLRRATVGHLPHHRIVCGISHLERPP